VSGLLVLTRNDSRDDRMALEAERDGQEVLRLALLGTEPGRDRDRFRTWLESPPADAAIAWTSRRAAEALLAQAGSAGREALGRLPLYAVGAESAAPIASAGLAVHSVPERPDASRLAEKMLAESAARGFRRAVFLHGDRALPDLPLALRDGGIEVEPFELYRIRFLSPDVASLERALEQGRQVLAAFFSPSGVEALERLLAPEAVERFRAEAWTMPYGSTTGRALRERGYARVPEPLERGAAGPGTRGVSGEGAAPRSTRSPG
jgi:uroporphyrinogen-III synthase